MSPDLRLENTFVVSMFEGTTRKKNEMRTVAPGTFNINIEHLSNVFFQSLLKIGTSIAADIGELESPGQHSINP